MNTDQLVDAIGDLDDDVLIEYANEVRNHRKHRNRIIRIVSLTACILVAIMITIPVALSHQKAASVMPYGGHTVENMTEEKIRSILDMDPVLKRLNTIVESYNMDFSGVYVRNADVVIQSTEDLDVACGYVILAQSFSCGDVEFEVNFNYPGTMKQYIYYKSEPEVKEIEGITVYCWKNDMTIYDFMIGGNVYEFEFSKGEDGTELLTWLLSEMEE